MMKAMFQRKGTMVMKKLLSIKSILLLIGVFLFLLPQVSNGQDEFYMIGVKSTIDCC